MIPHRAAGWHRPFLLGRGVSAVGSQVTFLCLPAAVASVPGTGAALVAVFEGLTVLGFVLFAVPAGVLADRIEPRRALVACDIGRAVAMVAAGWALFQAQTELRLLMLILSGAAIAAASVLTTVNDAAAQRLIVERAEGAARVRLNSWLQGMQSSAQFAGPLIAGVLIVAAGAAGGLVLDAVTFAACAVILLAAWRPLGGGSRNEPALPGARAAIAAASRERRGEALAGFRILRRLPALAAVTASIATANLFAGMYGATYVVFALRDLEIGGVGLGLIGVATAAGGVLGSFLAARLLKRRTALGVLTFAPLGYVALALVPLSPPGNLWLPGLGVLAYTCVAVTASIAFVTFRQNASTPENAGRVAAASRAITTGVFPASAALAVLLLVLMPVRSVIWIAVLGEFATASILLTFWWRGHRGRRRLSSRTAAAGSSASVTARTTTTRVAPSAST